MLITDHIDVQSLNARIKGDVVTPGEDSWDAARQVFNLVLDQRPSAIVFVESVLDVVEVMRFARANGLRVAPQSTGHNAGPIENLDDTLLVKTSRMRAVQIDAEARRACVQAGARWEDVTARVSEHGLAALHGSSPDVGIVGYSLGGGNGLARAQARPPGEQRHGDPARHARRAPASGRRQPRTRALLGAARRRRRLRRRDRHQHLYADDVYRRLQAIKTLYDPDDLIRANHPIMPT